MKKVVKKTEIKEDLVKNEMPSMKYLGFYVPLFLLAVVLAAAGYGYFRYFNVAVVNGRPISRLDYIKAMEKQGGKQVLDGMVQEALITGEAQKKGVRIDQSVIDAEFAKIETQLKAQGQTLDSALASQGMTKEELTQQIRIQKTAEKLANVPTEVSQTQIDDFIAKNKDQFPKTATKEEIEKTAKTQLLSQAKSEAITKWFDQLKRDAKIIYK